ncbi:putative 23S rRNA pseudouridine955/2504/2580 synthase [Pillotina sp. SPG140]|jgi:23S rRNA pseudouridine955/2504/2580 synthase
MVELITAYDDADRRLDRIMRKAFPDIPLSTVYKLIRTGKIRINGEKTQAHCHIPAGSVIHIDASLTYAPPPPVRHSIKPDIVFEGNGLLAVNKPAGIVVHGKMGKTGKNSLESQIQQYLAGTLRHSLSFRPGPLHRLDRETSGVMCFSTTLVMAQQFTAFLRNHAIKKRYYAIVEGIVAAPFHWEDPLMRDSKNHKTEPSPCGHYAVTDGFPLAVSSQYSFVSFELQTGFTHQIRAHAALHNHPLAGDKKYGGRSFNSFFLHAFSLDIPDMLPIVAPLPTRFYHTLRALFGTGLAHSLIPSTTAVTSSEACTELHG